MPKASLQAAPVYCLAAWVAIWLLFLLIRVSSFDIRIIPGIGPVMLLMLVAALTAPIVAMGIAGMALVRCPRTPPNRLVFGCSIAAFVGQWMLFAITQWL